MCADTLTCFVGLYYCQPMGVRVCAGTLTCEWAVLLSANGCVGVCRYIDML